MTFYDDAEFAAIKLVRLAAHEGPSRVDAMTDVIRDMLERHGQEGIDALCIAMARQYSAAVAVVGDNRGISALQVIDEFEGHKLEQIADEEDDAERFGD